MRRGISGAMVACLVFATWAEARDLGEILRDKGVLTDSEYGETAAAEKPETAAEEKPTDFNVYWKDGLRFDSRDKRFRLKLGGRAQNDWALIRSDNDVEKAFGLDEIETGVEFRRARLYVSGKIYERVEFKVQYDFAGGDADFKDVYVGLVDLPVIGNVRVGHFKEPFSLDELTSSKYLTFLERALPNAFVPSRNTGIMVHDGEFDERMTWAVGAFRNAGDFAGGFGPGGEYNVTARVTGLPWYQDDGRKLLHLGFSYSHQFRTDDMIRYRERPEAHLSPARFVDTSAIDADGVNLLNPEAALVVGPFSAQGEYMRALVDSSSGDDLSFQGGYAQVSYFITGENRNYKTSEAAFDRVKPKRNFLDGKGGCGAWEVAVRYSNLDLNDEAVRGGDLDDISAAINWYLNPNVRVMLNYVWAHVDSIGEANVAQGRVQVDF